jgi:hypothetical protein
MADDPLESVLRLVAEGRLTAEEAAPILDALGAAPGPAAGASTSATGSAAPPAGGPGKAIRIEITERGRKVVNLRVPLSLGHTALARIPGLADAMTDRIREALEAGISGPIVTVDDDGDGVRVVIE